ncbi:MAG: right-handed parallel beta-helix repeat-containing protein [bacterium]
MSRLRRSLRILPFLVLALPAVSGGSVRRVPSQYATINAAIDAAASGDSVLVAPGVYDQYETRLLGDGYWYSSVVFLRGEVSIVSEGGAASTTLRMDSASQTPVVLRAYGESGTATVDGFTVTGSVAGIRGLSFTWGDHCVIRDCVFRDLGTGGSGQIAVGGTGSDLEVHGCHFENINGATGSAIHQTSGTLLLENSEFTNCRSGAIQLTYDSGFPHITWATIRRCRFSNNTGVGGSVGTYAYSTVLIEDCWFERNRSGPGGGALGLSGPDVTIRNNTFVGNSVASGLGGAVDLQLGTVLLEGNTFYGNFIDEVSGRGGSAVYLHSGVNCTFRRNVVAASTGGQAVGVYGASIQPSCDLYWDNAQGNTAGFVPDATDLIADPMFCDTTASDLDVNAASPCLPGNGNPSCTELIGAWGQGCGTVAVEPSSWGRIKNSFRSGSEEAGR